MGVGRIDRPCGGAVVGTIHPGDAGDGQRCLGDIGAQPGHRIDGVVGQQGAATRHEGGADGRRRDGDAVGDVLVREEPAYARSGDGDGVTGEDPSDRGGRGIERGDQGAVIDATAGRKPVDRQGRRGDIRRSGQREVRRQVVISQRRGVAHEGDAAESDRLAGADVLVREGGRSGLRRQGVTGEEHRGDGARGRGRTVIGAAVRRGGDARAAAGRRAARDELERRDDQVAVHQGHDVIAGVGAGGGISRDREVRSIRADVATGSHAGIGHEVASKHARKRGGLRLGRAVVDAGAARSGERRRRRRDGIRTGCGDGGAVQARGMAGVDVADERGQGIATDLDVVARRTRQAGRRDIERNRVVKHVREDVRDDAAGDGRRRKRERGDGRPAGEVGDRDRQARRSRAVGHRGGPDEPDQRRARTGDGEIAGDIIKRIIARSSRPSGHQRSGVRPGLLDIVGAEHGWVGDAGAGHRDPLPRGRQAAREHREGLTADETSDRIAVVTRGVAGVAGGIGEAVEFAVAVRIDVQRRGRDGGGSAKRGTRQAVVARTRAGERQARDRHGETCADVGLREGIAALGDDGARIGSDQASKRHAARGRGAGVVDLVVGRCDRGQRLGRDGEAAIGHGDVVIAERRAADGDGDQAVGVRADVRAGPATAGGDRIRAPEAGDRRCGIRLERGVIDRAGGRADDGQRRLRDIGGDAPDAIRRVVGGAEAGEADPGEVHGLARADVGVGEGTRHVGADDDVDGAHVAGQNACHLDAGGAERRGGGGVIDLALGGDARGGKRSRRDGARRDVDVERVVGAAVAVGEDVAVLDHQRRSAGAEDVAVGESLRETREGVAAEQPRDGRDPGRSRRAVVDLGVGRGAHGERRRGDGGGRGHAGGPAEGVIGQRGRVALHGHSAEGDRLAARDVLGVERSGSRRRRERIAAQQAEHVHAARRRGAGVVDLVVGRSDDAGTDAAVRAEEELERRDRERPVRLGDGIVAQRSAEAGGHGEHVGIGADVATCSIARDGHRVATGQTDDSRRGIGLGRSVVDERRRGTGHRQRRRGDGQRAVGRRDGIVSQGGPGTGHGGQDVGIAAHVLTGGGAGDGEAVATPEARDGRGGVGAQGGVVDHARGSADDRQRRRGDREHALRGEDVIIAEIGTPHRGERKVIGIGADILAGSIAIDRDRIAAQQADDRRAIIGLEAAVVDQAMVRAAQAEVVEHDLVHRVRPADIGDGVVAQRRARTGHRGARRDVEAAGLGDRGRTERRAGAHDGARLVVLGDGGDGFGGDQTRHRVPRGGEEAAIGAAAVVGGRRRGVVRDAQRSRCHREGRADIAHVVVREAGADRRAGRTVVGARVHDRGGRVGDDRAGPDRRARAEGAGRARDRVAGGHAVDDADETGDRDEAAVLRHAVVGEVRAVGSDGQRRLRDREARGHRAGHAGYGDARGQQDAHRAVEAIGVLGIDAGSRDDVGLLAREDAITRTRTGDAVQEIRQREIEVRAVDGQDDLRRAGVVTQARGVRGRGRETRGELVLEAAGDGHAVGGVGGVRRAIDFRQVGAQHHLVGRRDTELDGGAGGRTGLRVSRRQVGEVDGRIDQRGRRHIARMIGLREDRVVEGERA